MDIQLFKGRTIDKTKKQENKKNVHAYIKGYVYSIKPLPGERKEIYYNPYKVSNFMLENNALHECNYVVLCNNRVYKVGE